MCVQTAHYSRSKQYLTAIALVTSVPATTWCAWMLTLSCPTETQVRSLMPYWYKPKITREEAIEYVLPMNTGSFIVRDSSTVKGGYALTLKITETIVRTRKKLTPGVFARGSFEWKVGSALWGWNSRDQDYVLTCYIIK